MQQVRLDNLLVIRGLVESRSQAENFIKLGFVVVNDNVVTKPGSNVSKNSDVKLTTQNNYVSRGGMKLESVASDLELDFRNNVVLDVGSSTGGFSDYALRHGARHIIAVDSGKEQLHARLRADKRIDLREQTDIRQVQNLDTKVDKVLIDVSFISLREVLPHIKAIVSKDARIVAMVKPQFESLISQKHKGVIKNDQVRRQILKDFEQWARQAGFKILSKSDSKITGQKGNLERFYLLQVL